MIVTRVTFDFFKKGSNGVTAHKEWSETVDIFGARKRDVMTEDGRNVQERYTLLLFVEMGLSPTDLEEFDYHTVKCTEYELPDNESDEDDESEDFEDDEAEYATIINREKRNDQRAGAIDDTGR